MSAPGAEASWPKSPARSHQVMKCFAMNKRYVLMRWLKKPLIAEAIEIGQLWLAQPSD
jgi:hypothetical protein